MLTGETALARRISRHNRRGLPLLRGFFQVLNQFGAAPGGDGDRAAQRVQRRRFLLQLKCGLVSGLSQMRVRVGADHPVRVGEVLDRLPAGFPQRFALFKLNLPGTAGEGR